MARAVFSCPALLESVEKKISVFETSNNTAAISAEVPSSRELENYWLPSCPICMGILATPRVPKCGHSMCGICLENLCDACTSNDVEVEYNCPVCRMPIEDVHPEISLDDHIQRNMAKAPDSQEKIDWSQRILEYQKVIASRKKSSNRDECDSDGICVWDIVALFVIAIAVVLKCRSK